MKYMALKKKNLSPAAPPAHRAGGEGHGWEAGSRFTLQHKAVQWGQLIPGVLQTRIHAKMVSNSV